MPYLLLCCGIVCVRGSAVLKKHRTARCCSHGSAVYVLTLSSFAWCLFADHMRLVGTSFSFNKVRTYISSSRARSIYTQLLRRVLYMSTSGVAALSVLPHFVHSTWLRALHCRELPFMCSCIISSRCLLFLNYNFDAYSLTLGLQPAVRAVRECLRQLADPLRQRDRLRGMRTAASIAPTLCLALVYMLL
jgi:hypothetical protein